VNERFAESMRDRQVAKDTRTMGDFVGIWCDAHHRDCERAPIASDAAVLGVYGRRPPVLCEECAAHLRYGEARRAYCPKDPKPFCAHCDSHCYTSDEAEWQRQMMRFSGPRSMWRGHMIDGLKHMREAKRHRADQERRATATTPEGEAR
jgi:hypothetical protein